MIPTIPKPKRAHLRDFHAIRARAEMECALAAADPRPAALHLELSSLHRHRALSLGAAFGEHLPADLAWLQGYSPAHRQWLKPRGMFASV